MEKSEKKSSIWGWIFLIFFLLVAIALLFPATGGIMHLFKVYGAGIGLTFLILLPLSGFSVITPVLVLIFDIISISSKRKNLANRWEQSSSSGMFDEGDRFSDFRPRKDGVEIVSGDFIDVIYYLGHEGYCHGDKYGVPDRKKIRFGNGAVTLLLMFMGGVKGFIILFFLNQQIVTDTHLYMPWNF